MATKKTAAKKTTTTRRTTPKTKSYDEIESEIEALSEQPEAVRTSTAQRKEATLSAIAAISVDNAVKSLTEANLTINKTLNEVSQQVLEKTSELEAITDAIKFKEEELQGLFDKEVLLLDLAGVLSLIKRTKEEFLQQRMANETAAKERSEERQKEWEREGEEYEYNLKLQRKKVADEFLQKDYDQKRKFALAEEEFNKSFQQRESVLKAKELEFEDYKKQVTEFPAKLDAEVKKQVAIATASLRKDLEHTFALKEADYKGKLELATSRAISDERTIADLRAEIDRLRGDVKSAQDSVRDIAGQAAQAVSGRSALDALQQFSQNNGSTAKAGAKS